MKEKKLIFISGTGRSGTHLIGRSVASHPEINGRIEDPYTFKIITKLGTTQDINSPLMNWILTSILDYRLKKVYRNSDSHILEKSHPSLWLVEHLMKTFNNIKFIGVYRGLEATINSMLNHQGVLSWYDKLPLDRPNRFLGISEENKDDFSSYSLTRRCALRWLGHMRRLKEIKKIYPEEVLLIEYDAFIKNTPHSLNEISEFLGVENKFDPEEFKISSLDKWKEELSPDVFEEIQKIKTEFSVPDIFI